MSDVTQSDTRNIVDKYRGWETDLIARDLASTHSPFMSVFVNVDGDFNKASGVRNMNWFNGAHTVMAGRKQWDKRGAVGTHHYSNVSHIPYDDLLTQIAGWQCMGRRVVAAAIDDRAVSLVDYAWPYKVAVLFGEENAGLSEEVLDAVDDIVYIPGRGSVRSLNVSTTSGIFMYDYHMKRGYI